MFTTTTTQAEVEVREFCATFPGANVARLLALDARTVKKYLAPLP